MLKFMRKNARSVFIQMAFFIIIVVFVFWGIGSFRADKGSIAAKVDNTVISASDFLKAYRSQMELYKRIYGDTFSEKVIESLNIKENVLNSLIGRVVIIKEARQIGIDVSKEELIKRVKGIPGFQKDGVFDKQLYLSLLRREGLSPGEFEESLQMDMLIEKAVTIITDSVRVTEEELKGFFNSHYRRIFLRFTAVKNSPFKEKVNLKEEDAKKYFDSHRESFKIPRRIAINYLVITPDRFISDVAVSKMEIEDFYKKNPSMFKDNKRSDIDTPLPFKSVEKTIKEALRAEKALKLASKKADKIVDLALKESLSLKDAALREGFNNLMATGLFSEEEENIITKDPKLSSAAFSLKQGEISNPVNSEGNLYIMELSSEVPEHTPEYKDVRMDVINRAKEESAKALARDFAAEFLSSLKEEKDLASLAHKKGLKVEETGFFSRKDTSIPKIDLPLSITKGEIFKLSAKERHTLLEGRDGFFIVELAETKYPDGEDFMNEAHNFKKELLEVKKREVLNAWIEALKKKAKIEINREAI